MKKQYYLAYGSNLNLAQMKMRCENAKPIGTAVIHDYQLLFKGSKTGAYLTIEPKVKSQVPVGVWEVTQGDILALDRYEGYPEFYYKKEMKVAVTGQRLGEVQNLDCFVYIMDEDRNIGIPSSSYVKTCLDGYMDFGFDEKFLINAIIKSRRNF